MKFIKAYLFQVLFVLGILTVMSVAFGGNSIKGNDAERKIFNSGWTCITGGEEKYYDVLPNNLDLRGSDTLVLTKQLPYDLENYNAISFFTAHDNVDVYVDGKLIYELRTDSDSRSKTPGNCWNFVELNDEYAGKLLSFVIEPAYGNGTVNIPGIYIGSALNMFRAKIADAILPLIVSALMLIFGVFVMIMSTCCRKKLNLSLKMFWLGLFASLLSVWSALETHIGPMIFGNTLIFSQVTFLVLKLALIPLICFVAYIYDQENKKIVSILCITSFLDLTVSCVLQFMGILDFRETIIVTHILCVVASLSIIILTLRSLDVIKALNAKRHKMIVMNSVCLSIVVITTMTDIMRYYLFNSLDSAKYGRIGLLIYIITLAIYIVYDSFELIDDGRQVENIKEIALVDGLTKVKNRNAYQQEISAISKADYPRMGIIMFDLNNLKYFNDVYGHSVGDYYIIICSEIIMDIFSRFGEVYRIGGDEFCAVAYDLSEEEFVSCQTEMSKRVNGLNVQFIENRMAIASGYARFDSESDVNLIETAQRADKQMYDKKAKMKVNANQLAN